MSDVLDPGRDARKEARKQRDEMKRQRMKQEVEKRRADEEVAKKTAIAMNPTKGRRSLINPQQGILKDMLG